MTKFELARPAGRLRPRSRMYVALAILFVIAWPTNAKDLMLPASRGCRRSSCLNEYGAFHYRSTILKCRITAVSVLGEIVGQALASEAIAECIRRGGHSEAESN